MGLDVFIISTAITIIVFIIGWKRLKQNIIEEYNEFKQLMDNDIQMDTPYSIDQKEDDMN